MPKNQDDILILKPGIAIPHKYTGWVQFEDEKLLCFLEGQIHRTDGPAIIYKSGKVSWYIFDRKYSGKDAWFDALDFSQKKDAVWSLDLWRDK